MSLVCDAKDGRKDVSFLGVYLALAPVLGTWPYTNSSALERLLQGR